MLLHVVPDHVVRVSLAVNTVAPGCDLVVCRPGRGALLLLRHQPRPHHLPRPLGVVRKEPVQGNTSETFQPPARACSHLWTALSACWPCGSASSWFATISLICCTNSSAPLSKLWAGSVLVPELASVKPDQQFYYQAFYFKLLNRPSNLCMSLEDLICMRFSPIAMRVSSFSCAMPRCSSGRRTLFISPYIALIITCTTTESHSGWTESGIWQSCYIT